MLGELEDALGVKFREGVDVDYINLEHIEGRKRFRKDGQVLHINLATLNSEEIKQVTALAHSQFEQTGRILKHEQEIDAEAIESGYDEELDEITSYFDGVLSERYLSILERALHLRALIEERNLSKNKIQEKKGQIARRYGSDAIYLTSLANAGYFDPDGGLRDLYVDLGLNPEYDKYRFQPLLQKYAEERVLCIFVENDEDVSEVTQEVRGRLAKYQRVDPIQEWFDIRGIGDGCSKIIDGVLRELEDEFIGIDYDQWSNDDDLWVRIYPRSLSPISG